MMDELEKLRMENLELRNQVLEMKLEKMIHKTTKMDERIEKIIKTNEGTGTTQASKILPKIIKENAKCYTPPILTRTYPKTLQYKYNIKECRNNRFYTHKNRIVSLPLNDVRYLKKHFNEYKNYTTTQLHQLAKELFTSLNTLQRTFYNIEIGTFNKWL